jgi:undecaprenyl pyrophosphate phosphatase UppP
LRLSIKVTALSIILAADLAFFIFFPTRLTSIYEQIFQILPWSKDLELTIILAVGLTAAIITSILLVRTITKNIFKSIRGQNSNE